LNFLVSFSDSNSYDLGLLERINSVLVGSNVPIREMGDSFNESTERTPLFSVQRSYSSEKEGDQGELGLERSSSISKGVIRRGSFLSGAQQNDANGGGQKIDTWGGTPRLTKGFQQSSEDIFAQAARQNWLGGQSVDQSSPSSRRRNADAFSGIKDALGRFPGLMIGLLLNLMLCVPFGLSFFPLDWDLPVPRAVGIQMWLFSTVVCQIVMTFHSDFPVAMGMMMVENIPFMHAIANVIMEEVGTGPEAFSTCVATFALSSIIIGV